MAISQNRAAARASRRQERFQAGRLSRETLLTYAAFLPELPRALIMAHLDLGMDVAELALLHGVTPRQMRRRLDRVRETLADPCFLLAAQYGHELPGELPALARAYWVEGRPMRELAESRGWTLHQVRQQIGAMRSLLLISLSRQHALSGEEAYAVLQHAGGML